MQWARPGPRQALAAGTLWLALALVFETGLALALGRSWAAIAADYNLLHGRLLPLVWLSVWLAPYCAARLERSPEHEGRP